MTDLLLFDLQSKQIKSVELFEIKKVYSKKEEKVSCRTKSYKQWNLKKLNDLKAIFNEVQQHMKYCSVGGLTRGFYGLE